MKQRKIERLRRSMRYDFHFCVDLIGKSGGLALWWKREVQLTVEDYNKNIIDVSIHNNFFAEKSFVE